MTKPHSQPAQPTPDDSQPSQDKDAEKGADAVTPDDSAPPQKPD